MVIPKLQASSHLLCGFGELCMFVFSISTLYSDFNCAANKLLYPASGNKLIIDREAILLNWEYCQRYDIVHI